MPTVSPERQQAVIGHLPARLEAGNWPVPAPGPSRRVAGLISDRSLPLARTARPGIRGKRV